MNIKLVNQTLPKGMNKQWKKIKEHAQAQQAMSQIDKEYRKMINGFDTFAELVQGTELAPFVNAIKPTIDRIKKIAEKQNG